MLPTLVSDLGKKVGGWGSRGTVAAETDTAETFKMHTPLIGNRADCVREKGNERSSSLCMWAGAGAATKGSGPSREAWKDSLIR